MTDKQYRNRVAKIEALEAQVEDLKAQIDKVKDEIKIALGDEEEKDLGDRRIFWQWRKGRETFETARFKKDYPDLAVEYLKSGKDTRAFQITAPKQKKATA